MGSSVDTPTAAVRHPGLPPQRHRHRRSLSMVLAVAAGLLASCVVPPDPDAPNPSGLIARLGSASIELSWTPTLEGSAHGYEVQVASSEAPWTTFATPTEVTASFLDVRVGEHFSFRVRDRVAPGAPLAEWSPQVRALYVEPVLPIVRIDTEGDAPILDRETYVRASMTLDPNGSSVAPYTGTLDIKGRGNSTWTAPKKPYRLRLDTKSPLMGIASNRHWVLLANYHDKSQLRSFAAGEISRSTDLSFTPTYRHVELVLNGRYAGVYQLTEQIRSGGDRVDIEEMEPEDVAGPELTGGYLMEIDERLEENHEPGWRTTHHVPVVVKEPDPMTPEQRDYIRGHIQSFETALFGPSYTDPSLGYRRFIDEDAFVDHYLVHELARNQDTFFSSTFFSKQRGDDRLVFGPIWDFDFSMGAPAAPRTVDPTGWAHRAKGPWLYRMFSDPAFRASVTERWAALAPRVAGLPDRVDAVGSSLGPAIANDEARWGYTLEAHDTPEYLADWLRTRIAWIDDELLGTDATG